MSGSQRYNDEEPKSKDANASHSKDADDNLIPKAFKITSKVIDRGYGINSQIKGHLRCGGTYMSVLCQQDLPSLEARHQKEQAVPPQRKWYLCLHKP
ncbi:hypothetical protein MAM1_0233d08462 [Mucor ambiguus]|uniref:Uncharacterized protein n=1 Tax=Mucor ambiguus TaxID=91626 RepID=A0A0C9MZA8_9FUNG|nr:hypothetical protein MAM1_0233d08462 [Mucor ambiguus]